jgi:hypothetical protein
MIPSSEKQINAKTNIRRTKGGKMVRKPEGAPSLTPPEAPDR